MRHSGSICCSDFNLLPLLRMSYHSLELAQSFHSLHRIRSSSYLFETTISIIIVPLPAKSKFMIILVHVQRSATAQSHRPPPRAAAKLHPSYSRSARVLPAHSTALRDTGPRSKALDRYGQSRLCSEASCQRPDHASTLTSCFHTSGKWPLSTHDGTRSLPAMRVKRSHFTRLHTL